MNPRHPRIKRPAHAWAAAACVASLLAACSTPRHAERFHTLLSAERAADASAPAAQPIYIDVLPVAVPAQVDRPEWVVRQPDDSLLLLEQDRWAAPLQDELRSAIVERLTAHGGAVDVRGVALPSPAVWRVRVDVQRFESLPGREARIESAWSISASRREAAGPLVCRSSLHEPVSGDGMPALDAAHRRAVVKLADTIGAKLQALARGESVGC